MAKQIPKSISFFHHRPDLSKSLCVVDASLLSFYDERMYCPWYFSHGRPGYGPSRLEFWGGVWGGSKTIWRPCSVLAHLAQIGEVLLCQVAAKAQSGRRVSLHYTSEDNDRPIVKGNLLHSRS